MSEKCFHCKRSLNKKFRVKVEENLYCVTCYEKLKKSGELKSKVTESKPQNDKPKANNECKCNKSKCCNEKNSLENEVRKASEEFDKRVNEIADKLAEEAANKFYEKDSSSNISLSSTKNPMLSNSNTMSLSLNTEKNTLEEKNTYSKHTCISLDISVLKRILKEFFMQKVKEDESRKTLRIINNNVQIEYLQGINKEIKETM